MAVNFLTNGSAIFTQIANNTISSNALVNISSNATVNSVPCPDQKVGTLSGGKFTPLPPREDIDYNVTSNTVSNILQDPIIIILESPHKQEYCKVNNGYRALGPAMGRTGCLFKNKFATLIQHSSISNVISNAPHDVVFVNAVQYQCSLGYATKICRDQNFIACFNNNAIKDDLQKRLAALNPFAIINLCTAKFRKKVEDCVVNVKKTFNNMSFAYTWGTHPSSWWAKNNQRIK